MPTPRTAIGVAVVDGKIHALGGSEDILWGRAKRAHEVYDPATDVWEDRSSLPTATEHAFAGVVDGKIYLVNGRNHLSPMNSLQIYDPATDTWSRGSPAPRGTSGMGAAVFRDSIYVYGGEDIMADRVSADLRRYEPAEDRWVELAQGPARLHAMATVVHENRILFLGGDHDAARADGTDLMQCLVFPPAGGRLAAPSDLQARVRGRERVRLRWKDNSDTETSFVVQARRQGKKFKKVATLSPDVRRLTVSGLTAGETYTFRVRAREGEKKSKFSNKVSVTLPD
jgi:N-acetylneuraminic acid mutarotase